MLRGRDEELFIFANRSPVPAFLSATAGPAVIRENDGRFFLTLIRSGSSNLDDSLAVQIASDSTDIELPTTVLFQPGEQTLRVPVELLDDRLLNGDRSVNLVVSADGHQSDTVEVVIKDLTQHLGAA